MDLRWSLVYKKKLLHPNLRQSRIAEVSIEKNDCRTPSKEKVMSDKVEAMMIEPTELSIEELEEVIAPGYGWALGN